MKNRLFVLLALPLLLNCTDLRAQTAPAGKPAPETKEATDPKKGKVYPKFRKLQLDFSAGTRGVGVGAHLHLGESKWGVRVGYCAFPLPYTTKLTLSGYKTNIDLFNNFLGVQMFVDYRPSKNSRFKLIAGLVDFYTARLQTTLTPTGTYKYGSIVLQSSDVGNVHAIMDWSGLSPFLGFGFGSPHPKHKVGCTVAFGLYYLHEPKVTITGTNLLADNQGNEKWMSDNMESYRYLPIVNFHLNYRFKK